MLKGRAFNSNLEFPDGWLTDVVSGHCRIFSNGANITNQELYVNI